MSEKYPGDKILRLFAAHAVNRNNYIEKLIRRSLPARSAETLRVMEFGAGLGTFLNRFSGDDLLETYAVEADPDYRTLLSASHRVFEKAEDVPVKMDLIYLIDVLEHLEDDKRFLDYFRRQLAPGGRLFIYVPARSELFSSFDAGIGHFRRYNRKELIDKVEEAGLHVVSCRYHELAGYFAAAVHNILLKKKEPSPASIRYYDKFVVPLTNGLERWIKPPIGKSLYLTATAE
jgi:SAM-dependent methyltransferase